MRVLLVLYESLGLCFTFTSHTCAWNVVLSVCCLFVCLYVELVHYMQAKAHKCTYEM